MLYQTAVRARKLLEKERGETNAHYHIQKCIRLSLSNPTMTRDTLRSVMDCNVHTVLTSISQLNEEALRLAGVR
jgi:predicted HTH transcriptional regulator